MIQPLQILTTKLFITENSSVRYSEELKTNIHA